MIDFEGTWNKQFPPDRKASVIAGITAGGINSCLESHRLFDPERYLVLREFKDGDVTKLKLTLIVGGDATEHATGRAKPIKVEFPTKATLPETTEYRQIFEFSEMEEPVTVDQRTLELPNVVLSVEDLNVYLEWPNTSGGTWKHHQGGINLKLEARLDLIEEDGRYSLGFIPVKLHISRTSETTLRTNIMNAVAAQNNSPVPATTDPKIADLVLAIIELAGSAIGPDLTRNIAIPVFEFEKFDATPTALALSDDTVSVAARLDFTRAVAEVKERVDGLSTGMLKAFEQDLADTGGGLEILFDSEVLAEADKLPPEKQWDYLGSQATRSEQQIEALLVHSRTYAREQLTSLKLEMDRFTKRVIPEAPFLSSVDVDRTAKGLRVEVPASISPKQGQFGMAVNRDTLNRLVADVGGITRQGYTGYVSALVARGRLGYQVSIGTPVIDVTAAGKLEGAIDIDVFAGLYYNLRRWNGRWGRQRRVGLGVKGDPRLTVEAVRSNGLSIMAQINLNGLGIQTGLGSIIDKLINLLVLPFKKAIELILNGILALLSFVVVPARFAIPGQRTGVFLSKFDTRRYLRHEASDHKNTFLLVQCDVKGGKLS